ncbi:hypothetical protein [Streptomyces sp. NPDC003710]
MGLVDSFAAVVLVERHLFALIDSDPDNEEPFIQIPDNSAFLAYDGSVVVASNLEDQRARVRVEIWDSVPDTPTGPPFRSMGEPASVTFESERIQLVNLMFEPQGDEYELTGAGPYRVRVWGSQPEEDPEEELATYRRFERFVLQLWR